MFEYFTYLADQLDISIFAYDYIGYGLSQNLKPREKLCYESFETVMYHLLYNLNINATDICLVGHSLGTGIVVDYISKNNWVTPCILISPYKSICRIVADTCSMRLVDKFESIQKISTINCPIKIFHGKSDKLILISHSIELYKQLKDKSLEPVWFEGIGHNDILSSITKDHYMQVLNHLSNI